MKTIELKSNLHKIIDSITSDQLLHTIHDFLVSKENTESGSLWNSLTEEQKEEVMLAYEESNNETDLLDANELF